MVDVPHGVMLETIAHCNARCPMCPISTGKMPKGTMGDELFAKIVGEVAEIKDLEGWGNSVTLHGTGEPTLYKKLPQRVEALSKLGVDVTIVTNGSLMNEKLCRALLHAGVFKIEFSIDSLTRSVYERIRPGLSLDDVLNNFMKCCRLRNEIRPKTHISWMFVSHNENVSDLPMIRTLFGIHGRPGDSIVVHPRHNFGGKFPEYTVDEQNNWCWQAARMINILFDGTVNMCCVDDDNTTTFGNINDNSILDIYNSERYSHFRSRHLDGGRRENPICAVCNVPEASLQAQYFAY